MEDNNEVKKTLVSVLGGRKMTWSLQVGTGLVQVKLDGKVVDRSIHGNAVKEAYGNSPIVQKLRRGEEVPIYSPHLAQWALRITEGPDPEAIEIGLWSAFLAR